MDFLTKLQMQKIMHNEKSLLIAYDQGLEHGPTDFNLNNINPDYVLKIAEKGKYNAIILHHGIAEKYYDKHNATVPLIIKLNGKTNLVIQNNGETEPVIIQDEQVSFRIELRNNVSVTQTITISLNTESCEVSETDTKEALERQ